MRLLAFAILSLSANAFASETTFFCKETNARTATVLRINAESAKLGDYALLRDKTYVPGNNRKFYYRYSNSTMDVLVPKLIASNRANRGVIIVYTGQEKIRLSCLK